MLSIAGAVLRRCARPTAHRGAALPRSPVSSSPLYTTTPVAEPSAHAKIGGDRVKTAAGSGPPPIRVSLTESAGRGVFATRPIGAGDLIHTASPVVAHPSLSLLRVVCYYCLRRRRIGDMPALSASGGSMHYFCSERCREQSKGFLEVESRPNWSAYDAHCKERELKYPFLVKRLACMVISGTVYADCLDILQPAGIYPEMIPEMEEEFELLKLTFMNAKIDDALVTSESAVGNAVYMLPSFYNHDCALSRWHNIVVGCSQECCRLENSANSVHESISNFILMR